MFMPAANTAQGNLSRPFILGVLLLLLLISTQSEWAATQKRHNQNLIQVGQEMGETQRQRQVKDDILLELSILNQNLEKENKQLYTIALELNRELSLCGKDEKAASILEQLESTSTAGTSASNSTTTESQFDDATAEQLPEGSNSTQVGSQQQQLPKQEVQLPRRMMRG
eukprot:TRINITY_DN20029_c0_g1_i6.p1 TRINITY_DN20029_c0_g1~~TRINITY_DN20029_c0_g1_i6.p1  ORF type:complete len:169 (+),score=19.88 TRINITY_DN20029_c0_g1_i6:279-785(+)